MKPSEVLRNSSEDRLEERFPRLAELGALEAALDAIDEQARDSASSGFDPADSFTLAIRAAEEAVDDRAMDACRGDEELFEALPKAIRYSIGEVNWELDPEDNSLSDVTVEEIQEQALIANEALALDEAGLELSEEELTTTIDDLVIALNSKLDEFYDAQLTNELEDFRDAVYAAAQGDKEQRWEAETE